MPAKIRVIRLALSFWNSDNILYNWGLMLILTVCTITIVLINMLLNQWQVDFYNQLQQYNFNNFISSLKEFVIITGIYVLASGFHSYFRRALEIRWRYWLTNQYIVTWLNKQTYYRLNLTTAPVTPDQHISEDVRLFITNTLDLSVGLLRHTVMLLVFSVVLWQLSGIVTFSVINYTVTIPGYLLWLALLYSILGTCFILRTGHPLINRNLVQQTNEAEFRACLTRIAHSDESVALYGGEPTEHLTLKLHFHKLTNNFLSISKYTMTVTFISSGYSQLSLVFAFLIASPRYFSNDLQLGQLFEISGAYWYVHSALSYIINSFDKIVLWKAITSRLDNFSFAMFQVKQLKNTNGIITTTRSNQIKFKDLTIFSPSNHILIQPLSLTLHFRDKILISGPTGSGKSTLLRTIAGIWPYFTGTIFKPLSKSMMFLPQKSYIPPLSLRQALLYPNVRKKPPDYALQEILEKCTLSTLINKLDQIEDWDKILSSGEQQCFAFARIFLYRPQWLFLDEATSNLDSQTEQKLYVLLTEELPDLTLISVGHHLKALLPFHTLTLSLDGLGSWNYSKILIPDSFPSNRSNQFRFMI